MLSFQLLTVQVNCLSSWWPYSSIQSVNIVKAIDRSYSKNMNDSIVFDSMNLYGTTGKTNF